MPPTAGPVRLVFVLFLLIQAVLFSNSRFFQHHNHIISRAPAGSHHVSGLLPALLRRSISAIDYTNSTLGDNATDEDEDEGEEEDDCVPLSVPVADQCSYVLDSCEASDTVLSIPYLQNYFCTTPSLRPLVFIGLLIWLAFLFSTLGISASDFFCPNLATLSARLGLDESVAGVTFLAFGNGSPDVFSTFSAMRAGAGALAIGELIGAASFIVSVVAGAMCIIRPFQVAPRPFLRDVGFFTAAVALLLVILKDGLLHEWEALMLMGLYGVYVSVVVLGSWWERRQFRKKQFEYVIRSEYRDEELPEPYRDDPSPTHLSVPTPSPRARAHSSPPAPPSLGINTSGHPRTRTQTSSRSPSPNQSPRVSQMPSFSLAGALEFRQVVASLQRQSSAAALSAFESPISPYAGGHYHTAPYLSRRTSAQSTRSIGSMNWEGSPLPLHSRSPLSAVASLRGEDDGDNESIATVIPSSERGSQIPLIETTPASPSSELSIDGMGLLGLNVPPSRTRSPPPIPRTRSQHVMHVIWHIAHVLFPTLHRFREKSVLGMIASILAAPAVLALTVTLPVHVTPHGMSGSDEKATVAAAGVGAANGFGGGLEGSAPLQGIPGTAPVHVHDARLVDFEEEGIERVLTAEDEVEAEMHSLKFNKWLMATQMLLGPLFCAAVLLHGVSYERQMWLLCGTGLVGVVGAGLVLVVAERGDNPVGQLARCFMGFFVAVIWIMAIADEVVNVLKTFGFIFGLSDAIIGLTIFAMGNSLADFVANISVAAFAPAMGFAACFGGPMLNILLGVGAAGTAVIRSTAGEPYELDFSMTLLVSGCGLLVLLVGTLVCVPLNGFMLSRRWGVVLVVGYVVIMVVNVLVEVHGQRRGKRDGAVSVAGVI